MHKLMKTNLTDEDFEDLYDLMSEEKFREIMIRKVGTPTRVEIMPELGVVEFSSFTRSKVKRVNIEELLAHARGEVH